MSVLTKVFVVLVTFLSILLVALIVPFVAKTQDYQKLLEDAKAATRQAQSAVKVKQNEITEIQTRHATTLAQVQSQAQALTRQLDTALDQLNDTRTQIEGLKADNVKTQSSMSRLTASVEQLTQQNDALMTEVSKYRTEAVDGKRSIIELTDRNQELSNQVENQDRLVRQLREQMEEKNSEVLTLQSAMQRLDPAIRQQIMGGGTEGMSGTAAAEIVPQNPISGKVTAVEPIAGETYIEINVGSNDGVEPHMKFWIHRNSQFLGTAVVEKVDVSASAARVKLLQEGTQIVKGDSVLTGGPGL